jgi:predicted Zn-dependent peptidase
VRNLTEANNIHLVLAFEGANYKNSLPLLLAQEVLGNGRRMGRLQQHILNKHVFISEAQALNVNYSDTGLFGIKLAGASSHVYVFVCRPKKSLMLQLPN